MGFFTVDNKHKTTTRAALSHNTRAVASKALPNECETCGKNIRRGNQFCSPRCTKAAASAW